MDESKGYARYDQVSCEIYEDRMCQAPNPINTEKGSCTQEIGKKIEVSKDASQMIIQDARVNWSSDDTASSPQYIAYQRTMQRIRQSQ
jgi:hypothetical protein